MDQSLYTYLIYFTVLYAIVFQIREVSKRQLNSLTTNEKNYIPTALSRNTCKRRLYLSLSLSLSLSLCNVIFIYDTYYLQIRICNELLTYLLKNIPKILFAFLHDFTIQVDCDFRYPGQFFCYRIINYKIIMQLIKYNFELRISPNFLGFFIIIFFAFTFLNDNPSVFKFNQNNEIFVPNEQSMNYQLCPLITQLLSLIIILRYYRLIRTENKKRKTRSILLVLIEFSQLRYVCAQKHSEYNCH
ncbi:hypothetical protein QTP88_024387 [Uroleucon formosanum]